MIRIAIDAMGGDDAPSAPVKGALLALRAMDDIELVLVGDPDAIKRCEEEAGVEGVDLSRRHVHDAPEVAGMHEDPVRAVRASKKVSARACVTLLKAGDVHGVVNMGSTGAAVAAATLYGRRLAGVKRLGIAAPFPRPNGVSVVLDGGANPDASPEELFQYGVMGLHYVRAAFDIERPRIGILSIGGERHKGNRLVASVWEHLGETPFAHLGTDFEFIGNVEPHDLFCDRVDVAMAEGFSGNIAIKAAEGMGEFVLGTLGELLPERGVAAADTKAICDAIAARVDYSQYGGAPLLGIDGGYLIGHGRSGPEAFVSGVRVVRTFVQRKVGEHIVAALRSHREATDAQSAGSGTSGAEA